MFFKVFIVVKSILVQRIFTFVGSICAALFCKFTTGSDREFSFEDHENLS